MSNPYDVERTWPDYFLEHRRLFEEGEGQGTYKCGDLPVWTVHAPLGYLGNSAFIEGDDEVIVYDTGVNAEAGAHIYSEIRKVTDKPITTIFYSHHHTDHYNGTSSIVTSDEVASGSVRIYVWDNFVDEMANEFGEILNRQAMGIAYYGGALLPPEELHHHGIGLKTLGGSAGYVPPTDVFSEDTTLEVSGIKINVFYTGGEAISEFGIHLPDFDLVIIADEMLPGYANTHTIRGSKPRLPENYMKALDRVRELRPEWLLGSHNIPLQGKDAIYETVTRYRDVIQYLWDQSIRLINQGYTQIELQQALQEMPDHLIEPPFSVPTYGTPFTNVPEYFTGWVSWFTGDSTDLNPSPPRRKAEGFVDLMGGVARVLDAAKAAHSEGDHQYAAELAQLALRAAPENEDAKLVKAAALRARGYQEVNPIARSWYLSGAYELEGAFDPDDVLKNALRLWESELTATDALTAWRYKLDAKAAGSRRFTVGVEVSDTGEELTLTLRNSTLGISEGIAEAVDAVVSAPTAVLVDVNTAGRAATIEGDTSLFAELVGYLDQEAKGFYMHQR